MQFRILGPIEVVDERGELVDVGGAQSRALLAMLLVAGDRVVPVDAIIDRLWPENQPPSAMGTLQSYVSRLRRALEPGRSSKDSRLLSWESTGYRLAVEAADVDFVRFEQRADEGRDLLSAGSPAEAEGLLVEALGLWRGDALVEFADRPWARGVATRLDERRLTATEDRIRARLMLGRHDVAIAELTDLVDMHPLHERFREHLALALYRSGRQVEALRTLDDLRRRLRDDLGVDPGRQVRDLEAQILAHDPTLNAPVSVPAHVTVSAAASAPAAMATVPAPIPAFDTRAGWHVRNLSNGVVVGRETERARIAAALDRAADGRTQWVLLEGEPGIGKTFMLEHLCDDAALRGFMVTWGRASESGSSPAFWPWLPPLRGLLAADFDLAEPMRSLIADLLSPIDAGQPVAGAPTARFQLFEAIAALLQRAAHRQPLVIALDDLQWADPASLELIDLLTGYVLGAPLLFAFTVRELEIGRNDALVQTLAQISRRPMAERIPIVGLGRTHSESLVRHTMLTDLPQHYVGGGVGDEVVRAIFERSDGNPFFMTELARLVAKDAELTEAEMVRRVGVPAGVRDVVHRRLARLAPPTLELVQVAAAIGRQSTLALLSSASGFDLDECLDRLEPALVERLVTDSTTEPGVIQFSHTLVREVVLDDMSALRRARLHLRVADAIEGTQSIEDDSTAEVVAEHLWQATSLGIAPRAAAALERAATVAMHRFAYARADDLLSRALQLRKAIPRDRADADAELVSITRLGAVRRARFGFEQASQQTSMIDRGMRIARDRHKDVSVAELLWTQWAGAATTCQLDAANGLARQLLELGEEADEDAIRWTAAATWGIQCWHEGRMGEAMASLDRWYDYVGPWRHTAVRPGPLDGLHEHELLARGFHTIVHELAGKPVGDPSPLITIVTSKLDPYQRLTVWVSEAVRAILGGDHAQAFEAASRAQEIDAGPLFEFFRAAGRCVRGSAMVLGGDPAGGVAVLAEATAAYEQMGVRTVLPFYLSKKAEGHLALGDVASASAAIEHANEVLHRGGEAWNEPFVLAAQAATDLAAGSPIAGVEERLRRARAIAIAQDAFGSARRVVERAQALGLTID
jgi:DNA-binding SARP family transcriptional activator